jgi:hypothetical protein
VSFNLLFDIVLRYLNYGTFSDDSYLYEHLNKCYYIEFNVAQNTMPQSGQCTFIINFDFIILIQLEVNRRTHPLTPLRVTSGTA